MIKTEHIDGLLHTYSDSYLIRQKETGAVYYDAWDTTPCRYTYEETDEPKSVPSVDGEDFLLLPTEEGVDG